MDAFPLLTYCIGGNLAADYECVSSQGPLVALGVVSVLAVLSVPPQEHYFTHIVQETSQLEPLGVAGLADPFGSLEKVNFVGEVEVRVGGVHVGLQLGEGLRRAKWRRDELEFSSALS